LQLPWSGRSFFLLPNWTPAPDLDLYTDSSGTIGYGAYCNGQWFNGGWTLEQSNFSIQYKELYPIVLASSVCGHNWRTLKVRFICDNQAVVHSTIAGTSHCPHMMHLLRNLFTLQLHTILQSLHRTFQVRQIQLPTLSLVSICRNFMHMHPRQSPFPLPSLPVCP